MNYVHNVLTWLLLTNHVMYACQRLLTNLMINIRHLNVCTFHSSQLTIPGMSHCTHGHVKVAGNRNVPLLHL